MSPIKNDYVDKESCITQTAWIKKLFLALAALVFTVGGGLFALTSTHSNALGAIVVRVQTHKESILEIKQDIREIKASQQKIQLDTAKILSAIQNRRNITNGGN